MIYQTQKTPLYVDKKNSFDFAEHAHHSLEIAICVRGLVKVSCNFTPYTLEAGQAMIVFPNDIHAYDSSRIGELVMIIVDPNLLGPFSLDNVSDSYGNFAQKEDDELINFALTLLYEYQNNANMQLMVGYLHIIISKIIQALPLAMKIKSDETFIKILCYLSQHYAERISLKTLSEKFGLSEEHISRSFRQKIGKTFLSHLHALRVKHAKILLKSSVLTITVVAYESGFVDLRTFNRVFKTLEGVTPSEYRKQGGVIWAKTKK